MADKTMYGYVRSASAGASSGRAAPGRQEGLLPVRAFHQFEVSEWRGKIGASSALQCGPYRTIAGATLSITSSIIRVTGRNLVLRGWQVSARARRRPSLPRLRTGLLMTSE